ncbi:3'(2'),5'-bisphosphate nucleotidase CysQ [Candidatus Kaiserbacteria bacterium]|nr:3'(2'),5'-bisphosphate nucleotidase CysQ [Candidatus Kaiserbacteria bacterium]
MITLAIETARKAGKAILSFRQSGNDVVASVKEDQSPVTGADLASDVIIREGLLQTGIPIVSEESSETISANAGRYWLVDPLDGTKDFITGSDDFCVMIALIENGRPALAVVYVPMSDTLYAAERGKGAYVRDAAGERPLRVSSRGEGRATFVASEHHFTPEMQTVSERMGSVISRRGSNGIKVGLIAEGKADYTFASWNFSPWDIAAPQLIVEEAGGRVSGVSGGDIRYDNPGAPLKDGFIASNGSVQGALLEAVKEVLKHPSA